LASGTRGALGIRNRSDFDSSAERPTHRMGFRVAILANPMDHESAHLSAGTNPFCPTTERRERHVVMCPDRPLQEEGEYEYISDHGGKSGNEEHRVESAILVQPLSEGALAGEGERGDEGGRSFVSDPLCEAGSEGPCVRDINGGQNCRGPHGHPENCSEKAPNEKDVIGLLAKFTLQDALNTALNLGRMRSVR
jgi:hypothetical protein